ncbi:class I SAM-dependent methyltransferase [Schnuerera sp. xch1]|uniref:tRNA (adenine(22)-N(1))-methyltransferase n=1 Tax=Schnuerera sp. xch1 TaxID=2874283 RepID=UPI001CBAF510|nr:class I SAM-dependent methyltransferase [Schnuerera sp. xch1]MBZ2175715.1 class I SAM-dependent methyltransferase [Schnuerera sp. xch1]
MILSERLQSIADFIPNNTIVGDIGTDHGYLPVYLIENKIAKKVIATDISNNSLNKIIQFVESRCLKDFVDIRLGDGLEIIKPFEIDTVVIAGMGGILIKDILNKNKDIAESITNFILQPNIATKELREYLYQNEFEIIDEKLVEEGNKFYEIIYAKKGKMYLKDNIYLELGEKLILNRNPLLKRFIYHKIGILEDILQQLQDKDTEKSKDRYYELMDNIKELKGVLNKIEGI